MFASIFICVVYINVQKIKSSLYSPYYAEACNELRGPSPRLSAWATQLRRNVATVASRWRHCVDLTGPGIEPQTSRTDSVRLATELTAGLYQCWFLKKDFFGGKQLLVFPSWLHPVCDVAIASLL